MARNMRSGNLRWGPKSLTRTKQPWLSLFKDRGPLPEKVCSLALYCRKRKQLGLPLTPARERFFHQLVNVHVEETVPKCHELFLEGLKQGATIKCVNF